MQKWKGGLGVLAAAPAPERAAECAPLKTEPAVIKALCSALPLGEKIWKEKKRKRNVCIFGPNFHRFFFFLPQKTVVKDDCAPSLPMFLC